MHVVLWILAAGLATLFVFTGTTKLQRTKEQLVTSGQGWAQDWSPGAIRLIGLAEVAGAVGLIVPPLTGIVPVLAPIAAVGLALTMISGAVVHARRGEWPPAVVDIVIAVVAGLIAWGRFGPYAF